MIPDDIRTEILRRMHAAEEEHGVRVLLAKTAKTGGSSNLGLLPDNGTLFTARMFRHTQT